MSSGTSKTRARRLAAMEFVPTRWGRALANLQRTDVELRLLVLLLFIIATACVLRVWDPPFPYHTGSLVDRDIVARVNFQVYNAEETDRTREAARNHVFYTFDKKPDTLEENINVLRALLNESMKDNTPEAFSKIRENFEPLIQPPAESARKRGDSSSRWRFLLVPRTSPEKPAEPVKKPAVEPSAAPSATPSESDTPAAPQAEKQASEKPAAHSDTGTSSQKDKASGEEIPSSSVSAQAGEGMAEEDASVEISQPSETPVDDNSERLTDETRAITIIGAVLSPETGASEDVSSSPEAEQGGEPNETLPAVPEDEKPQSEKTEVTVQDVPAAAEEDAPPVKSDPESLDDLPPGELVDMFCNVVSGVMAPFVERGLVRAEEAKDDPLGRGATIYVNIYDHAPESYLVTDVGTAGKSPAATDASTISPVPGGMLETPPVQSPVLYRPKVELQSLVIENNAQILTALRNELGNEAGEKIYNFVCRRWTPNLVRNMQATLRAIQDAGDKVPPAFTQYERSQRIVSVSLREGSTVGVNLTAADITLLRAENKAWLSERNSKQRFYRTIAALFMLLAMITPTVCFVTLTEPQIVAQWRRLIFVICLTLLSLVAALLLSTDTWRFTLLPIVVYSQLITIQNNRRIGLVAGLMLAILVGFGLAVSMTELLLYFGVLLVAVLPVDRIRGRLQFIKIALGSGVTAFLLSYSNDMLSGQPVHNFYQAGASYATYNFLQLLLGGFLIQGILPLLEKWLGVLSDARLLELCDQSNPLLSELIDRAPSTYSHSMAVGAIGERAAEAIRCDGLLVRASSYYHDIGKIYKPDYYAENQSLTGVNHHLDLEPTMSALIIIAHIKNGVDIARQYKIPEKIVDIIQQHHGTTLVKYFYSQAVKKSGASPDQSSVDESTFSYPGPKPQTKEAVIVMLADCCESACRTIVDPTPKRIEGLVSKIVQERLEEGQFDESGMTLRELRTVEDSIVKSLISNYHGRIKYPEIKKEERGRA